MGHHVEDFGFDRISGMYILGTVTGTAIRFFNAAKEDDDDDDDVSTISMSIVFVSTGLESSLLLLMERIPAIRSGPEN